MRLSKYLKEKHPQLGTRAIKRALERGACIINGRIETYGSRLIDLEKDKIEFQFINIEGKEKLSIKEDRIIFQDKFLIIYNKEPRYPALATEGGNVNLHQELKKYLKLDFLQPVHRLDKDTSGLMIFAKTSDALTRLNKLFTQKEITKSYLALTDGTWDKAEKGIIDNYIELAYKKGSMQKWRVSDENKESKKNKKAISKYSLKKKFKDYSLIELEPQTGRTHQLRVHLASLGHPILGDTIYCKKFKSKKIFLRHMLHAEKLKFKHPFSQKDLCFTAPLEKDMEELMN